MLRPAHRRNFTVNTFGITSGYFLHTIISRTRTAGAPTVVTVRPDRRSFINSTFFTRIHRVARHDPIPFMLRLSRNTSMRRILHTVHYKFASMVVSNSLLPCRRGITLATRIIHLTRTIKISIRNRLKAVKRAKASMRNNISRIACASPTRTTSFVTHANTSALTITVNATRNVCPGKVRPGLRVSVLHSVTKHVSVPLILRNNSTGPSTRVTRSIALNINGVGVSDSVGCTCFRGIHRVLTGRD